MKPSKVNIPLYFYHILFWVFFLSLPYLLRLLFPEQPPEIRVNKLVGYQYSPVVSVVMGSLNIPLFYLNSEILIKKLLQKKGIGLYLLVISALIILMYIQYGYTRELLFDIPHNTFLPRAGALFQIMLIVAISTLYRIIADGQKEEAQRKEQETERLKSELSFLRSQISPHFMFNVLNSIVSLSRRKPEKVEPVVIKLSELMRYMLYESDGTKVTLGREVSYLQSYIELQKLRFGDSIQVNFELGQIIDSKGIEPMLLIPFVENAFKHGVGMIEKPEITIKLSSSENGIAFFVKNDLSRNSKEVKDNASGIGLTNVKRRLELLYPESHELTITEKEKEYSVNLIISQGEKQENYL
jgi:two-component system, LytTR family, sensor kinase